MTVFVCFFYYYVSSLLTFTGERSEPAWTCFQNGETLKKKAKHVPGVYSPRWSGVSWN